MLAAGAAIERLIAFIEPCLCVFYDWFTLQLVAVQAMQAGHSAVIFGRLAYFYV